MSVIALGYLVFGVKDLAAWRTFSTTIIGAELVEAGDGFAMRVDTRAWRIAVEPTGQDDLTAIGWEAINRAAFAETFAHIEASGTPITHDDALAKIRDVQQLATFTDPAGIKCELFWGARDIPEHRLVSPTGVQGFVTGPLGLGHIVVGTPDMAAMGKFYAEVLGFRYSDHIDMTVENGAMVIPVDFYHCNPRHHTLAFAPTPPDTQKLIHFMVQTVEFDDVGLAIDRANKAGIEFATTLGRHNNDHMLSVYIYTPSGFELEYGYGARNIDHASWIPASYQSTSTWGHKFVGHGMQRG